MPATIEFLDTPGLLATERRDNPRRLGILRECGGLLVVLSGFNNQDMGEELRRFREELLFADLEIVTNRVNRLEDQAKKPKPAKECEADAQELELLRRIVSSLEHGRSAAELGLTADEEKTIRSFQMLTLKPELALVNATESEVGKPLSPALLALAPSAVQVLPKLELELEELPESDRLAFVAELGLGSSSRGAALRMLYYAMGEIVFFTVGEDECRAWSLTRGENAVAGAGKIHTDLAKRFVRAEVVAYDDFRRVGQHERSQDSRCVSARGEDLRRARRRYHAHPVGRR